METRSRTWLARNVRHVCDGGERRFGSRRETVRSATSIPSFCSSPWIRGAPQRGLACAIRTTRALIWRLTRGRPAVARAESLAQYPRKRRRCHRRTGLGDTKTRACLQPAHTLDDATQNSRSLLSNFGPAPSSCRRRAGGAKRGSPGRPDGGRRRAAGGGGAGGGGGGTFKRGPLRINADQTITCARTGVLRR